MAEATSVPDPLQVRVLCDCGFLAKNNRGLSIHQKSMHKENNVNASDSTTPDVSPAGSPNDTNPVSDDVELFGMLLSKCRSSLPIVRIIQKSVRSAVSQELAKAIDDVLIKKDTISWFRLLAFPYIVLNSISKKEKHRQNAIRSNLSEFVKVRNVNKHLMELLEKVLPKTKKNISSEDQVIKIATRKVGEGDFSGAIRVLCSNDTIAESNSHTLDKLKAKHPEDKSLPVRISLTPNDLPVTTNDLVTKAIKSFHISSAGGIDGLRPRHIKDLTSFSCGDTALKLTQSISKLVDVVKNGNVPSNLLKIFYSGALTAFNKDCEDVRPIAVGLYWRRLSAKILCYENRDFLAEILKPIQLGFGVKGGAEAIVHAVKRFIDLNHDNPTVLIKLDFKNAFNMIYRWYLLYEVKNVCPDLMPLLLQAYGNVSNLYYDGNIILSERGVHQGDPLGPATFCIGTLQLIRSLQSKLNAWLQDDGTIGGDFKVTMEDISKVIDFCKSSGMVLNSLKCEVFFLNCSDDQMHQMYADISNLLPGIKIITEVELLGAPLSNSLIPSSLRKKKEITELMCQRLMKLDIHPALCLLKSSLSSSRFMYLLRSSPTFLFPNALIEVDEVFRSTLEHISNIKMSDQVWRIASLPFSCAGLGIRKLEDLSIPAYYSSIYDYKDLSDEILSKFNASILSPEVINFEQQIADGLIPVTEEKKKIQKNWDKLNSKIIFDDLLTSDDLKVRARLLASSKYETSKWLQVVPSSQLGLLMDNNTTRIAIALRLGGDVCVSHTCKCGVLVDESGHHGLCCKKCAGRLPRHASINKIISQALYNAGFPNLLEPPGISRIDGKRPDGVTINPWTRGKSLLWDATVRDTLAPSYLLASSREAGSLANQAELQKHNHYVDLKRNYCFTPISFETLGSMGLETKEFLKTLGKYLVSASGDSRAPDFLLQRISVEIQRGNAASILCTPPSNDGKEKNFFENFLSLQ